MKSTPFTARSNEQVLAPAQSGLCTSYSSGWVFARYMLTVATLGTGALAMAVGCAL